MKVFVSVDELFPLYCLSDVEGYNGYYDLIDMSEEDYKEFKRIEKEYFQWRDWIMDRV